MSKAVIFHNTRDIDHYFKSHSEGHEVYFTTHYSCCMYLEQKYRKSSSCLSGFLDLDDIARMRDQVFDKIDHYADLLDQSVGKRINDELQLNMLYFKPLYSYWGKIYFHGLMCIREAVDRIGAKGDIDEWVVYDYQLDYHYEQKYTFKDIFAALFPSYSCRFVNADPSGGGQKTKRRITCTKVVDAIQRKLRGEIEAQRFKQVDPGRKTLVMYEPLYDLDFLKKELNEYNIIYYKQWAIEPTGFSRCDEVPYVNLTMEDPNLVDEKLDPLGMIFIESVLYDFERQWSDYIAGLLTIKEIHERYPIKMAIWGNPPVYRAKALMYEYLRSQQVSILGCQHGASHVDQVVPWSIDQQYNMCTHYVSYGFDEADQQRSFPNIHIKSTPLPYGRAADEYKDFNRRKIDLVFPMTSNLSVFEGGLKSIAPGMLGQRQKDILMALNQIKDIQVYVKPVPNADPRYYAFKDYLAGLKNIKVVYDMTFKNFLKKYDPKAVVFEYPSTPLYEVIGLDTEIFMMTDPLNPFEDQALEELRKRVHVCEETDQLIDRVNTYLQNKILSKRDNTFNEHYVHKSNRVENILNFINTYAREQEAVAV